MPDFPLHPTLLVSLSILFGLALSYFFTFADMIDKKDKKFIIVNLFLYGCWMVAALFAFYIVLLQERAIAFAPLGMMIAALIASASVMKNIAETKANETKKHEKEDSKFYLEQCVKTLEHIYDLLGKQRNDILAWREAASMLITMKNLSKYITQEPHIRIFNVEYNKYSAKILNTFIQIYPEQGCMRIKPSFFCCDSDWQTFDIVDCFEKSKLLINPKFIIPIFQFAQTPDNSFLENLEDEINYENWRDLDLTKFESQFPWILAIDYLKYYKEYVPLEDK